MKRLWVALLLVFCVACTGADRRDPDAVIKANRALERGDLDAARMHAENAYHHTPDDPETRKVMAAVHRALGVKAEESGEFDRAADAFVRAAEREPMRKQRADDYIRAFENGQDAGREPISNTQLLLRSLDANPNDLEVRLETAMAFDELGQAKVAIEHYLYVWEADRSQTPIGMRLGLLYGATGANRDAEAIFRRIIERDPENVQAQLQLAELYEKAGQGGRARSIFDGLAKKYPDNASILFRFADFLDRYGEPKEAKRVRGEAQQALPGVERREMRELRSRKKKRR